LTPTHITERRALPSLFLLVLVAMVVYSPRALYTCGDRYAVKSRRVNCNNPLSRARACSCRRKRERKREGGGGGGGGGG